MIDEVINIISDALFFSHCLAVVGPQSSFLLDDRDDHAVPLKRDRDIFCQTGSERIGREWSAGEKPLEILRHGWELIPSYGGIHPGTELSRMIH